MLANTQEMERECRREERASVKSRMNSEKRIYKETGIFKWTALDKVKFLENRNGRECTKEKTGIFKENLEMEEVALHENR